MRNLDRLHHGSGLARDHDAAVDRNRVVTRTLNDMPACAPGGDLPYRQDRADPAGPLAGLHAGQYSLRSEAGAAAARPLGLYAFFYVCLHLAIFVLVDYGLDLELIQEAIVEKRYVLVGFTAFLLLVPLAVTSTKGWQRRLGKRWKKLTGWSISWLPWR